MWYLVNVKPMCYLDSLIDFLLHRSSLLCLPSLIPYCSLNVEAASTQRIRVGPAHPRVPRTEA